MQKYIDLHTHSLNSPDADDSVRDMCLQAAKLGLFAYAVTDHCEMNDFERGGYRESTLRSLSEIKRVREQREKNFPILLRGVELGQALENRSLSDSFCDEIFPDTDFIIGSLHNLNKYPDFAFLDYSKENILDLMKRYFSELNDLVRWGRFDSLGHITYPLRYITGEAGISVDLEPVKDLIDEVLRFQAEQNRAIEVNTSGLRQKLGETMPPLWIVKRFRELGGRYVTVGSDAHCIDDLGKGIIDGVKLIKEAGFSHITYYQKHQPRLIPIDFSL